MEVLPKLRSRDCNIRSFSMIINSTERIVDVYWIDYNSKYIRYITLPPSSEKPINTYTSHPWVFKDNKSGELMNVNNDFVYWPKPWYIQATNQTGNRRERVFIHLPLRSLKEILLWQIFSTLKSINDIESLEIPQSLVRDLSNIFFQSKLNR